jgi:hypothetical protein
MLLGNRNKDKGVTMRWVLTFLLFVPALAFAKTHTYWCDLKSHDDSLQFTISDPRLSLPVIIGANGSNPLKKLAELVTPDREIMIILVEERGGGGAHINNLIAEGNGFRAVHQRWSNPDPKGGFYGKCTPL